MGRKSLREIDAQYDLTGYLIPLAQVPSPLRACDLWGRPGPWEIEVGSGKGLFLAHAAATQPERFFLGIEISLRYAKYTALRLLRASVSNARVIHGDAQRLFAQYLEDSSVEAVHVYFPDPWWKKRHRKRRLMNAAFLKHVERVLMPGGRLHFRTDVADYFDETVQLIAQQTNLQGPVPVVETDPEAYRTHFERRMLLQGLPVYRAEFFRSSSG